MKAALSLALIAFALPPVSADDGVTLAQFAAKGPPKLFTATKGAVMPNYADQTNNLKEGECLLLYSQKLTDITGISQLTVEDDGRADADHRGQEAPRLLNDNRISKIPDDRPAQGRCLPISKTTSSPTLPH